MENLWINKPLFKRPLGVVFSYPKNCLRRSLTFMKYAAGVNRTAPEFLVNPALYIFRQVVRKEFPPRPSVQILRPSGRKHPFKKVRASFSNCDKLWNFLKKER